jgi:ubiquinone/menaquinone biosynthesis C-methylase UbiE
MEIMTAQQKQPGGNELLHPRQLLERAGVGHGQRVADLGCGAMAYFTLQAARQVGERGQVYAVDIQREVLSSVDSRARLAGLTNVRTVWSDLEKVGAAAIPPATLDTALLVNTLFQLNDYAAAMAEAARLLKSNGKLLVVDWKSIGAPFGPPSERRVSPGRVKDLATAAGFKLLEEFEAGPYHFGQIYEKK